MPRIKIIVSRLKLGTVFPVRIVEWTYNSRFNVVESKVLGTALPTNGIEVYRLNIGQCLKYLSKLEKLIITWLINKLQKLS